MFSIPRSTAIVVAVAFLAGCSSGIAGDPSVQSAPGARATGAATRTLPGPAVEGPLVVPLVPTRSAGPRGWPLGKNSPTLFIAEIDSNEVVLYDSKGKNLKQTGSITDGLSYPAGLAVDTKGTLYVSNDGNDTITEYPAGKTSPSVTLTNGLDGNYGVAVDRKGDVFATNLSNNTVVGYKPGKSTPFETVSGLDNPVGIATDSKGDVYVACDSNNTVYVIPAGKSTLENSGITGLAGPIGVSFTKDDTLYVSNFAASNVFVIPKGKTSPSKTITDGISAPTLGGFLKNGAYFQSNESADVVGYKKGSTSPYTTLTGVSNPLGIAAFPLGPN